MQKLFIALLLFSFIKCVSQTQNDSLMNVIKSADKILLTSHQDLFIIREEPGKYSQIWRKIIEKGKPNKKIIKEKIILDSIDKTKFINLILNQKPEENFEGAYCFEPHHTIFFFINKKWEYIDICFDCENFNFSDNLNINRKTFLKSYEDWKKLESFFRNLNFSYKMPKQNN